MRLILVLLFLLLAVKSNAQSILKQKVSVVLDSSSIEHFVRTIEGQIHCHFYYDEKAFDSFFVKMHVVSAELEIVLKKAFDEYQIYFFVDQQDIFLTSTAIVGLETAIEHPLNRPQAKVSRNKVKIKETTETGYLTPTRLTYEENKIYDIGIKSNSFGSGKATVAGFVKHNLTGEGVSGASITVENTSIRTITDQYGYFSLNLPKGAHTLKLNFIGLTDTKRKINLYSDGKLTINMTDYITALNVVNIAGEKSSNIRSTVMGMQKIGIKSVKQLPTLLGEADIVRVILNLPGVTSVGEGSTGLNVRGGAVDQNLVLFDGATVFNPSHFFGFFSGFNPDVVKDAELYKSFIPAKYGSRLSSVLEVVTREGNRKKFSGSGGIGPLSSHLTFEGPIGKKTAFITGIRSTYSDWVLKLLDEEKFSHSTAGFYDANIRITHEPNEKNSIIFTAYKSNDRFKLDGDTAYKYGNTNGILKWKHNFNNRLYSVLAAGYDSYNFTMKSDRNTINDFKFQFGIAQQHAKLDFVYAPNTTHKIESGMAFIKYGSSPGDFTTIGNKSAAIPVHIQKEQGYEAALYLADNFNITPELSINAGLRASLYAYTGPREVFLYPQGIQREEKTIIDTVLRTGTIKSNRGLEPRIALRYSLSTNASIKLSYNRTRQNMHMLSNSSAANPIDTWKLSDEYINPQIGDQISFGFYRNLKSNTIETSIEVYYKRIRNALTYISGAKLLLNPHIETDIANATGKAYGIEFLIKKNAGKLNGWVSYTYSRTLLKMDDPLILKPVNNGDYFPADYDKPHVFNFISNYKFSHRFSISFTANYATGRPITMPVARYFYGGSFRMLYGDRNTHRVPDYFRTDLSMNIEGNHKVKKLFHSSFTLGVYNLTARKNPYSVYFTSEDGKIKGYKLSIFGTAIPFVTYNFKF